VLERGQEFCFRHLPTGVIYGRPAFLAPAAVIDLSVLRTEIEMTRPASTLLSVDPFSVVISEEMKGQERALVSAISSTGSGTGAATAAKSLRSPGTRLIRDVLREHEWLKPFVRDVRPELNRLVDRGYRIVIEGTQGFGLSLHHSGMYPQTTSKDTTAAQFVMEAGLSPLLVDEIVLVVRTFPIRVAGEQAGRLEHETTWETIRRESGYPNELVEFTTVTRKLRRVGRFDLSLVLDACQVNRPTSLVVHGLDYLGYENFGVSKYTQLNSKAQEFLQFLRRSTGVPIKYAFTGRENAAVVADAETNLNSDSRSTAVA
jgi:adenylosuccinate synthase